MQNKPYHIVEAELAGHPMLTITHLATGNYASVLVGYGGAINAFVVNGKQILVSAGNAAEFEKITVKSFAGTQLFPFVNRVNNATYCVDGQAYTLPPNDDTGLPHSLHGLIYDQAFTIVKTDEATGKAVLNYHFKPKETAYPFAFLLVVEYWLEVDVLQIATTITNLSETEAPMAYGWHPYIAVDGKIDDCKLQLPATIYYETDDRLIPNGQINYLNGFIVPKAVGSTQLNQCFEMPANKNEHTTIVHDTDGTIVQLVQTGFAFTQYYIPPDRKSIAIEPQTAIPDALNNGIGLIKMQPKEVINFSFKIIVQQK